ncbi:MAG: TSUP family transporter [Christensenellales bacterium]
MEIVLLIVFGLIGGLLGGMGMGGGTLLIPLLTIGLNLTQQTSQAINLLAFLPMSVVALIIHFKNGLVNFKTAIPIALSGVISSVAGAFLANNINSVSLRIWFGVFLVVVGILEIYSLWIFKADNNDDNKKIY